GEGLWVGMTTERSNLMLAFWPGRGRLAAQVGKLLPAAAFPAAPCLVNLASDRPERAAKTEIPEPRDQAALGRMKAGVAEGMQQHRRAGVTFHQPQQITLFDPLARHKVDHF